MGRTWTYAHCRTFRFPLLGRTMRSHQSTILFILLYIHVLDCISLYITYIYISMPMRIHLMWQPLTLFDLLFKSKTFPAIDRRCENLNMGNNTNEQIKNWNEPKRKWWSRTSFTNDRSTYALNPRRSENFSLSQHTIQYEYTSTDTMPSWAWKKSILIFALAPFAR